MNCLHHITEEFVQDFCASNFGRKLTIKELNRMRYSLSENDDVQWSLFEMIHVAIENALENSSEQWNLVDSRLENGELSYSWLCKDK